MIKVDGYSRMSMLVGLAALTTSMPLLPSVKRYNKPRYKEPKPQIKSGRANKSFIIKGLRP